MKERFLQSRGFDWREGSLVADVPWQIIHICPS